MAKELVRIAEEVEEDNEGSIVNRIIDLFEAIGTQFDEHTWSAFGRRSIDGTRVKRKIESSGAYNEYSDEADKDYFMEMARFLARDGASQNALGSTDRALNNWCQGLRYRAMHGEF